MYYAKKTCYPRPPSFSTVVKLKATSFSLFCNAILRQTKPEEEGSWVYKTQTKRKKGVGVQRDKEEEEEEEEANK